MVKTLLLLFCAALSVLMVGGCGGGGSELGGGGGGTFFPPPNNNPGSQNYFFGTYDGSWNNVNDPTASGSSTIRVDANGNLSGTLYDTSTSSLGDLAGTIDDNGNYTGTYTDSAGNVLQADGTGSFQSGNLLLELNITDNQGTFGIDVNASPTGRKTDAKAHPKSGKTAAQAFGARGPRQTGHKSPGLKH